MAATFLVESYWPGVSVERLEEGLERVAGVADAMRDEGHRIEYLSCTLMSEDEVVLCLFDAESAAEVAELADRADLPCDRISQALTLAKAP